MTSYRLVEIVEPPVPEIPDRPVAPYHVDGKYVIDAHGRRILMRGLQLDKGRFSPWYRPGSGAYTDKDWQILRDLGYYFTYSSFWWSAYEDQYTGDFDRPYFQHYIDMINTSEMYGMEHIFRFRNSHERGEEYTWDGWSTHPLLMTPEGLDRYCNSMIRTIQILEQETDSVVSYMPWQWPFHGYGTGNIPQEWEDNYYHNVIPTLIAAARTVTDKPLRITSVLSDPEHYNAMPDPVDNNLIYDFKFYWPQHHSGNQNPTPWEINSQAEFDYQWSWISNMMEFADMHNVPVGVNEFGIRSEDVNALDRLNLKLDILDYLNAHYCYWNYTWWAKEEAPDWRSFHTSDWDGTLRHHILMLLKQHNHWQAK